MSGPFTGSGLDTDRQARAGIDLAQRTAERARDEDVEISGPRRLYITAPDGTKYQLATGTGPSLTLTDPAGTVVVVGPGGGGAPLTRLISTTAPLAGGGDLSADRTLSITAASATAAGSMSASDFTKLAAQSGTNTGDQTITLTGDVTGVGGGNFPVTISARAVTLPKMADVASGTVFYRKTAAAGSPEVQTLATLKTDLGLTGINSGDQTTVSGNAGSATVLQTPRAINGVNFDGSVAITINAVDATARVPATRSISTTAPLAGGGALSADLTLSITGATASVAGTMSAADFSKLAAISGTNTGDQILPTRASLGLATTDNVTFSDVIAIRSSAPTTGVLYLGNSFARYLYYNGSNYILDGADLYVNGARALTNGFTSPTFAGTASFANLTASGTFALLYGADGQISFGADNNGSIEIGKTGRTASGTPYLDFHSSANSPDFDVRMLVSGGNTASGNGNLAVTAAATSFSGKVNAPNFDFVSLTEYGVVGDGTTDDTAAIQSALSATGNRNKRIVGTPGAKYLITSQINIAAAPVILDLTGTTIILGTQNMNGIVIGNGTSAGASNTTGTKIIAPTFNVKAGVAAFTSGYCIYRNWTAYANVYRPNIYGRDGTTTKLWGGIFDYKATECDTEDPVVQYVLAEAIHCEGDNINTAGRTVDCNYDNLRAINVGKGIYIGPGVSGLSFYRPEVYGLANGGYALHINCTSGSLGQNFFIDTPDFEVQSGAAAGIYLQSGGKAIIKGGWVGASMGLGLKIDTGFDSADISCSFIQAQVQIFGPQNTISAGEIVGDYVGGTVNPANGLTIKGNGAVVASGVKIRQWGNYGIDWGGTAPTGVLIGALSYDHNYAGDIAPLTGFTTASSPIICQGSTDKVRSGTAAATITVPHALMQFTGATTINSIALRGAGTRVTIQAGAGGLTFSGSAGNIVSVAATSLNQYQTASFVCDGANWFLDGRS